MKYLMGPKYFIYCKFFTTYTHGGDGCTHESAICPYHGSHCSVMVYPDQTNYWDKKTDVPAIESNDLMDRIDNNDIAWAIQHLQSNESVTKMVAEYLVGLKYV